MTIIKSIHNLNIEVVKNLDKIRKYNIQCVVGIPRSGMIPASLIATHLQLPLTDVYGIINNNLNDKSNTFRSFDLSKKFTILLTDDSINTGKAMNEAVALIKKSLPNIEIIRFAVWCSEKTKASDVDLYCDRLETPRAFQWNLWNHHASKNWASDLDGVICRNPTKDENDKGVKLENFYKTADPLFLYKKPIKYVVTARLEKYRSITEEWLAKHGIKYHQLIMKQNPKVNHWEYKLNFLLQNPVDLYIESDMKQSKKIASGGNIPVWCVDNQTFYNR